MGSYTLRAGSTLVTTATQFIAPFVVWIGQGIEVAGSIIEGVVYLIQKLLSNIDAHLPAVQVGEQAL